ncbi:uncharacterized protein LOC129740346 [Uranotaenia lowii]|uniref:uncharacterized protein LOC129740346 n=1 Tax=Uranotaenia lowii TaxID=190385 RepID=UPI0024793AFC|nr:uncharacterized protein LOC129740346 [Uranotaenia lowii]XP_055587974.1 uncharacterized protein LOC129740346 [Uranotaenia lowii]
MESQQKMSSTPKEHVSNVNIGFIGGGNMAYAIAAGLINKGVLKPQQIMVSATNLDNLRKRWERLLVDRLTVDNVEVIRKSDIVFLCVKPHILPICRRSMEGSSNIPDCNTKLMVSILAGVTLERLYNEFSCLPNIPFVRTMPNTPMQVGAGCTIFCAGFDHHNATVEAHYNATKFMFNQLGLAYEVREEQIDNMTGLTGCGPAFVYQIIEALADGGVKQGIPREMAIKMAAQTVLGAAKTVLETGKHPAVLKDEVCSPGGATIHGVHELEKGAVRATLITAVEKSSARAKELS